MNYTILDFVGLTSGIMQGLSVLGLVVLAVGSWAQPSADAARTALILSAVAFWMIATTARNAAALLSEQADQIAELRRQLAERRSAA